MSEKIYLPESIADQPLPVEGQTVVPAGSDTQAVASVTKDTTYEPAAIPDVVFPEVIVARETISSSLNTLSKQILGDFDFGVLGAIGIGNYVFGVSGDIRISPSGIVARDVNGNVTFTLDGTTGSATFKGTVMAGSIISGNVGSSNIQLDGANNRIIINDGTNNRVLIGFQANGF